MTRHSGLHNCNMVAIRFSFPRNDVKQISVGVKQVFFCYVNKKHFASDLGSFQKSSSAVNVFTPIVFVISKQMCTTEK